MRPIRSGDNAASFVSTAVSGEEEQEEKMARRKLSLKEQLKGIRAALKSKRTPPQLRDGLRRRAAWLAKRTG
jgi:hypothetical protein